MMCRSHRVHCTICRSDRYETPTFKCQFIGCKEYSCVRTCQFSSLVPDVKIYVCHGHIGGCFLCHKKFPLTNEKRIYFRNGAIIASCTNCYIPLNQSITGVLLCLKRLQWSIPKNVQEIIFKFLIPGQNLLIPKF
jgi:hypothetical protein